jgi:trehalose/maltose hydrolase-like predicted phosphorylase
VRAQGSRIIHVAGYDPEDERRRESLFSLGNGVLLVRSAMPWSRADTYHYPGMYAAGCYNPLASQVQGQTVWNESIVNLPNGLALALRFEGEAWFTLEQMEILHYEQMLDLRQGIMRRQMRVRHGAGRLTEIEEERFVSMAVPNVVGLRLRVTPQNWSGLVEFRSEIDGSVENSSVEKHADYARKHLHVTSRKSEGDELALSAETVHSHFQIVVRTRELASFPIENFVVSEQDEAIERTYSAQATAMQPMVIDKLMAVFVEQLDEPHLQERAKCAFDSASNYETAREQHGAAWTKLWDRMPFAAQHERLEQAQHLTLFHLLQNYSPRTLGRDAGLPARGWQEIYRGQVFWDEMFAVPVLSIRFPELAREILVYRYNRLDAARENARKNGLSGALYPWRSARTGREETPKFQKNPENGHWREDHTERQVHINACIAWDIFHYVWATGDLEFFHGQGIKMLVEICRMWASLVVHDAQDDRFDICGIVGPDEFHTRYPNQDRLGVDNNAYTNVMAAWVLARVADALDAAPCAAVADLAVTEEERSRWHRISRRLRVHITPDGLICQFKGVQHLPALDPESLGEGSADWQLEARGKDINDYQLFKQADFAMLLYLLSPEELLSMFERLGYSVDPGQLHRSVEYYHKLTSHGSSLSQVSYAAALCPFDQQLSVSLWCEALAPDLDPKHAKGAAEGLHLGAMAASMDVLQRHYLGLSVRADCLLLEPAGVLTMLQPVELGFCYQGGRFTVCWDGGVLQIQAASSNQKRTVVRLRGAATFIEPGGEVTLSVGGCNNQPSRQACGST